MRRKGRYLAVLAAIVLAVLLTGRDSHAAEAGKEALKEPAAEAFGEAEQEAADGAELYPEKVKEDAEPAAEEKKPRTGAAVELADGKTLGTRQAEALGIGKETVFLSADGGKEGRAQATLVVGKEVRYGSYSTNYFYINGQLAYCLEPNKATPGGGDYEASVLENGALRKAMYYLMGGPGWPEVAPAFQGISQDMSYAYCHCVLSWIYNGYDDNVFLGFGKLGPQNGGQNFCKNVASWIAEDFPEPPDSAIQITPDKQEAVYHADTKLQQTGLYKVNGDERNSLTFTLPKDVGLYMGGEVQYDTVTVKGGASFYLAAPVQISGEWQSGELFGSITGNYLSFLIKSTGGSQDIGGLIHAETTKGTSFGVVWNPMGRILVNKKSAEDKKALPGAVFEILDENGSVVSTVVTGPDGTVLSPLLPPGKNYTVREKEAPDGYACTDQSKNGVTVYLDPDQSDGDGIPCAEVEMENPLYQCDLEVRKRIRAADIVWAHGNPSFLIEVTGADLSGKPHTYAGLITFTKEYVEKSTGKDGYVEAGIRFEHIPCGQAYSVMEAETSRYCLVEVSSADTSVSVKKLGESGMGKIPADCFSVSVDLLKKHEGTVVVFRNEKMKWNLWNHTAAAINRLRVRV